MIYKVDFNTSTQFTKLGGGDINTTDTLITVTSPNFIIGDVVVLGTTIFKNGWEFAEIAKIINVAGNDLTIERNYNDNGAHSFLANSWITIYLPDEYLNFQPNEITNRELVTPVIGDELLIVDSTTGRLKRTVIDSFIASFNPQDVELQFPWKTNYNLYQELTYTGANVTQINYWNDATKALKLFTKDITYTGLNPTTIATTDELTGKILTTTIVYSGDNILNITKTIA